MTYDYREALKNDIQNAFESYLMEEVVNDAAENGEPYWSVYDQIRDILWDDDSVTGNGSGSYTMNTAEAYDNLKFNWDLLVEAAENLGIEPTVSDGYEHGPEWWDVTIRVYLLDEVLPDVFDRTDYDELVEKYEEERKEEEE